MAKTNDEASTGPVQELVRRPTYGRGDIMALAAVRYSLGRTSYIVGDCSEWLIQVWPDLLPSIKEVIKRDIEEAFAHDDSPEKETSYNQLGHDCDRREWERVRALWKCV